MRINRREFFKSLTAGGVGLAIFPFWDLAPRKYSSADNFTKSSSSQSSEPREKLYEIASRYGSELGDQRVRIKFFRV